MRLVPAVSVGLLLCVFVSDRGRAQTQPEVDSLVGRVRVRAIAPDTQVQAIAGVLDARFAPAPGQPRAETRVLSVRPHPGDTSRFDATIYDYPAQTAYEIETDAAGHELSREPIGGQPFVVADEIEDAQAIVSRSPIWAGAIADGHLQVYPAMPSITVGVGGRRLVNVGIMSMPGGLEGNRRMLSNEVVSVDIPAGKVIRYPDGSPPTSSASLLACNPPSGVSCMVAANSCTAAYHVEWPAANPVWTFDVRHPKCTTSVQPDGTGLELTKVVYRGKLILERAEMPVINVKYFQDSCGPFRDEEFFEYCFQATGSDVPTPGSGIRVTTGTPSTICESGHDGGNFKGVAISDQGDSLWLVTVMAAGWYRYVMQWRLHLDGRIEPIIGFGATANGCTCQLHTHHAYWRFEWALGGVAGVPSTGIATLERRRPGSVDQYDPITVEGRFTRPSQNPSSDVWRIRNAASDSEYLLEPSSAEGSAAGDSYALGDLWALALNPLEINDPEVDTRIGIDTWANGEPIGTTKRLVLWHHTSFQHLQSGDEACHLVGPTITPVPGCAGTARLLKSKYGCSDAISVKLGDTDLAGAGTATVTVSSTTETSPETMVLAESPPNSGKFAGSIPSSSAPPLGGDGRVSVSEGDTLTLRYLDVSACGTPNVPVVQTAAVECTPPVISNVQISEITSHARVSWTTNEPATSVVHYGTTPPGASTIADPGLVTSHAVIVPGLEPCASYAYWVESADEAGNSVVSPGAGGSYAFVSGRSVSYASTGTPVAIPNNDPAGVLVPVTVPESKLVQDVDVNLNVTYHQDNDLIVSLIPPSTPPITLAFGRGGTGDNYVNTVFDDEASATIASGSAPFSGSFRPDAPLSAANGTNARGTWALKVADYGFQNLGTLDSWSLLLNESCPALSVPPPVPDGTIGTAMRAVRADAGGATILLDWDVTLCPAPHYHVLYGALSGVAAHTLGGGFCALGSSGHDAWTGVPAGNLWFVIATSNETNVEGSWGTDSTGEDLSGTSPSGMCGVASRLNDTGCP